MFGAPFCTNELFWRVWLSGRRKIQQTTKYIAAGTCSAKLISILVGLISIWIYQHQSSGMLKMNLVVSSRMLIFSQTHIFIISSHFLVDWWKWRWVSRLVMGYRLGNDVISGIFLSKNRSFRMEAEPSGRPPEWPSLKAKNMIKPRI